LSSKKLSTQLQTPAAGVAILDEAVGQDEQLELEAPVHSSQE
jgi:hypothetical protein